MRTCWLSLLGLLATACGGNFSNDDLEFLNALPVRAELTAKLPKREGAAGIGSALPLEVRPFADTPVAEGDPSTLYEDTHQASERFNTALDGLLSTLEKIRAQNPTTRAPDMREWGPVEDSEHPGHLVRFVMTRQDGRFAYQLQFRPRGRDEWWSFVEGTFEANGGLRRGTGTVSIQLAAARAHGFDMGSFAGYKRLDVAYQTRAPPMSVEVEFIPVAARASLRYTYREAHGGLGEMTFLLEDTAILPGNKRADLFIVSRWTSDRDGMARAMATGGNVPADLDATQVECWDARFRVTYFKRGWETAEVGNAAACPDVSALDP
ncbi:hypothetical protein [Melittangium boletus]|uniref:Lipoprotein n=1 Tax=Melittangium boletus DSM 14713 TaxID=1294270 RepID=A0A250IML2_9BACT|nr:hypothetical protein [Melittangium boletus]ATB32407.1 hypothetical protein MEBOL_005885 [Melittangium boletus DSM 14713]